MTSADWVQLTGIILVFVASNIGHFLSARSSSQKMLEAIEKQSIAADAAIDKAIAVYTARTDARIDELTRHVEKHNSVIDRTYKLEELTAVQTEQIKVANHRIEDLEKAAAR